MVLLEFNLENFLYSANAADWLAALGSLGVIAAFIALYREIKKDKTRNEEFEEKIESMASLVLEQIEMNKKQQIMAEEQQKMAEHQQILAEEAGKQTAEMIYQGQKFLEANELLERQVDIQIKMLEHEEGVQQAKDEKDAQKRLNHIRPFFYNERGGCGSTGGDGITCELKNKAAIASEVKLAKEIDTENVQLYLRPADGVVDNGAILFIYGTTKKGSRYQAYNAPFKIEIQYKDEDGNIYKQEASKLTSGSKLIVTHPELVELAKKKS